MLLFTSWSHHDVLGLAPKVRLRFDGSIWNLWVSKQKIGFAEGYKRALKVASLSSTTTFLSDHHTETFLHLFQHLQKDSLTRIAMDKTAITFSLLSGKCEKWADCQCDSCPNQCDCQDCCTLGSALVSDVKTAYEALCPTVDCPCGDACKCDENTCAR